MIANVLQGKLNIHTLQYIVNHENFIHYLIKKSNSKKNVNFDKNLCICKEQSITHEVINFSKENIFEYMKLIL